MRNLFPPGDTSWKQIRTPSRWREFSFSFHQVTRAIEPILGLDEMLENWNEIAQDLSEAPRKRKIQSLRFFWGEGGKTS